MPRPRPMLLVFLFVAPLASGELRAQDDARDAHGFFTGEIKAVLHVTDVEASVPFYRDVLGFGFEGFADIDGHPYYAEMAAGATTFGLHEPTSSRQEDKVGQQRMYVRIRDLQAHRSRVVARGGEPSEVRETSWMDMFVVRDPDGNEIVFAVTDPARHSVDPWTTSDP